MIDVSAMAGRGRKTNYPLLFVSCMILIMASWNVRRAEEDFHGEGFWEETSSVMFDSLSSLPDISSYAFSRHEGESDGVIILGMHRSGTSMLAGLLATVFGYYTGEEDDLIPPRYANAKGYFERHDIVRQNDRFMQYARQSLPKLRGNILFDATMILGYNPDPQEIVEETKDPDWTTALAFLNNERENNLGHPTTPWIQKDPRMCITIRTWLPYLKKPPAVLITYRHPAEVGHSVATRDLKPMLTGLKSWIGKSKKYLLQPSLLLPSLTFVP